MNHAVLETDIGAENRSVEPSSNSGIVCCVNPWKKDVNMFLRLLDMIGNQSKSRKILNSKLWRNQLLYFSQGVIAIHR